MGVQADECKPVGRRHAVNETRRVAGRDRHAELRVLLSGADELVGVRLDAGSDPHQDCLGRVSSGRVLGKAVKVVKPVHHDAADAGFQRERELRVGLVVPVQDEPPGGDAGAQCAVQLPFGRHVDAETSPVGQPRHRPTEERLRRERDAVVECGHRLRAPGLEVPLVVDEQGRSEAFGEGEQVAPTDGEAAVRRDRRGVGQQRA